MLDFLYVDVTWLFQNSLAISNGGCLTSLKKKETSVINLLHLSYFDCFLNIFYKFARKLRSDAVTLLFLAPPVEWSKVPLPMRKVWGPFHASLISIDKKILQVKVARLPMVLILTHVKALILLCLQRYKFFHLRFISKRMTLKLSRKIGSLRMCKTIFFCRLPHFKVLNLKMYISNLWGCFNVQCFSVIHPCKGNFLLHGSGWGRNKIVKGIICDIICTGLTSHLKVYLKAKDK